VPDPTLRLALDLVQLVFELPSPTIDFDLEFLASYFEFAQLVQLGLLSRDLFDF
jgi:hypothetical protein